MLELWHRLLAVPHVAQALTVVGLGGTAAIGWIKRKTIAAATSAFSNAVQERVWSYVRKKIDVAAPATPPTLPRQNTEITYRGTFQGCYQYATFPREHVVILEDDERTRVKIPVLSKNMFAELRRGDRIEFDTTVVPHVHGEKVMRVRLLAKK